MKGHTFFKIGDNLELLKICLYLKKKILLRNPFARKSTQVLWIHVCLHHDSCLGGRVGPTTWVKYLQENI